MGYTVYRVYIEQSDYISIYMYKVLCPRTCKSRNKPGGDAQGENTGGVRKEEKDEETTNLEDLAEEIETETRQTFDEKTKTIDMRKKLVTDMKENTLENIYHFGSFGG